MALNAPFLTKRSEVADGPMAVFWYVRGQGLNFGASGPAALDAAGLGTSTITKMRETSDQDS